MDQDSERDEICFELFFFFNGKRYTCRFEQNKTKLKTLFFFTIFSIKPSKVLTSAMSYVEKNFFRLLKNIKMLKVKLLMLIRQKKAFKILRQHVLCDIVFLRKYQDNYTLDQLRPAIINRDKPMKSK
jgi:hypothetical protein